MNAVRTPLDHQCEGRRWVLSAAKSLGSDAAESLKDLLDGGGEETPGFSRRDTLSEAVDFPDHERFLPATTPSNGGSARRTSIDVIHLMDRLRCMQIERCADDEALTPGDVTPMEGDNTPIMDLASLVRETSPMEGGWDLEDLASCKTPETIGTLGGLGAPGCNRLRTFTPMNLGLGFAKGVSKCC